MFPWTAAVLAFALTAGAGRGDGSPCAELSAQEIAAVARGAAAAVVVAPAAGAERLEPSESFEQALEAARDRAARSRARSPARDRAMSGGVPFEVVARLAGIVPGRLALPAPDCRGPAYVAVLRADAASVLIPLRGLDDPRLAELGALLRSGD